MSRLMKLWLFVVLGAFAYLALAVMLGATPGRGTEGFGNLAALIDAQAVEHGRVFTGIFVFILGCILASLGVIRAQGTPRNSDGGAGGDTGWFGGDCGDGGD